MAPCVAAPGRETARLPWAVGWPDPTACGYLPLLVVPVRAGGVKRPPASANLAVHPAGWQVCLGLGPGVRRCCCMQPSGGKPGVAGELARGPGAGLTCLVLCAPGAAASLRGNGRRQLSVTSDRCLLGLAGTTKPASPALSHWKGLLFRGRRHRRKRERERGKETNKQKSDILNQKEKKTFQNKPLWGGSADWSPSFTPSLKLLLGPGLWLAQVLVALGGGLAG